MNKKPPTNPTLLHHAREMRQQPTEPERRLWQHLRRKQLGGFRFRRQQPLGAYIVDFYCHEARLIVEVDGDSHAFQEKYDAERTAWLEEQGNHVIRFWNVEVMQNLDGVLQVILAKCEALVSSEQNQPPP
ncbi:endonuclease domain-containing protein [Candidatus Leptofilum sp.]|uniref:endonuclease domain-containing protein n=1 Tax=Candidatus Leptofilum sp. TaxID=3241576 RepID=UPI003B5AACD8